MSKKSQKVIALRGAMVALVIGTGWSCAQLIGADLDKPFAMGGTGGVPVAGTGGAGGVPIEGTAAAGGVIDLTTATGAGGAGGAGGMADASSTSSDASSASSSAASSTSASASSGGSCSTQDTVCGPDGKDGNCDGVVGDCQTQIVYVGIQTDSNNSTDCRRDLLDVFLSTDMNEIVNKKFRVVSQFSTFTSRLTNTTELVRCVTGSNKDHKVSFDRAAPCTSGAGEFKSLGFLSTKQASGYNELQALVTLKGLIPTIQDIGVTLTNNTSLKEVCCHGESDCLAIKNKVYTPTHAP